MAVNRNPLNSTKMLKKMLSFKPDNLTLMKMRTAMTTWEACLFQLGARIVDLKH